MTGAAVTNMVNRNYYNVPYGTPMYYGAGGPYYYNNGERRTVEDLSPNQKAVAYNQYTRNQQQKAQRQEAATQQYQTRQENKQNAYNQRQANKQNAYNQHHSNLQKQQNWYQNQLSQNPQRRQQWESQKTNPFVSHQYQDRSKSGRFGGSENRASSLKERSHERSSKLRDRSSGSRFSGKRSGGRRGGGGFRRGR